MRSALNKTDRELARQLDVLSSFTIHDAAYIDDIERHHAEARTISDLLDRYDALKDALGRQQQDGRLKNREEAIKEASLKPQENRQTHYINRSVIIGLAAGLAVAAVFPGLGPFFVARAVICAPLGFFLSGCIASIITEKMPDITRQQEKLRDAALIRLHNNLGQKLDSVFGDIKNDMEALEKKSPAVRAYINYKYEPPKPPTSEEIKQSIRAQFNNMQLINPGDTVVEIDPKGKKPSVRLKKY